MDKYVEFNAVKFLNDSRRWDAEKKDLEKELDSITEIRGIDYSPVRSRRFHDSVADVAAARERIRARIDRIDRYQAVLSYAWEHLSGEQKSVLAAFFFTDGHKSKIIRDYASKHAICLNQAYILRREAVQQVARLINDKFFTKKGQPL